MEKPLNLNIIVDQLFSLALRIPAEKRVKLKEIGFQFEQQTEVGSTIPPDTQKTPIIFWLAIPVMKVMFWIEDNSPLLLI